MPLKRGPVLPYSVVAGATPWGNRWVVASAKITGSVFAPEEPMLYGSFQEILDEHPAYVSIVVNSPIGYLDQFDGGFRRCDLAARALLGRRALTVRRVPTRATLVDGADATDERLDVVSSMRLPIMKEVAGEMSPYRQRQVYEGNPELSFYQLNQEMPLVYSKAKSSGRDERREVLLEKVRGSERIVDSKIAPTKHLLDAGALMYSARRVFLHAAKRLPEEAEWDSEGLRMEIVY